MRWSRRRDEQMLREPEQMQRKRQQIAATQTVAAWRGHCACGDRSVCVQALVEPARWQRQELIRAEPVVDSLELMNLVRSRAICRGSCRVELELELVWKVRNRIDREIQF